MTLLRRSLVALSTLLFASISAQAQVPLSTGTYLQDFDSIGGGLPPGWTVTATATATFIGTPVSPVTAATSWGNGTGQWQNSASFDSGLVSTATPAAQAAATNRALAVRQSAAFGDNSPNNTGGNYAAASFNFSTVGQVVTSVSFSAQMLSVQARSTTWQLQYGFGPAPTTWTNLGTGITGTYTDPNTFSATTITPSGFGTVLDNQTNVWIRMVTLTPTANGGVRDTFGIDNFTIVTSAVSSDTPPSIDTPPAGQTVNEGDNVQFTVAASGTAPLSYQWRKYPGPALLTNSGNISGAFTDTLTLMGVAVADGGSYDVVVTNSAGSATGGPANLTVIPLLLPPAITNQPVSQAVAIGGTANFSVTATGTAPLTYQWRRNGGALAGETNASLTVSSVTADAAGAYDVVVSNGINPDATSGTAILSVPSIITPASQIAYTGGTYAQSFDTLPASGSITLASAGATTAGPFGLDAAPINASGLAGWSVAKYDGTTAQPFLFRAESGSGNSGSIYSFGEGAATERALGSLSSGSTVPRFGLTLINSTGRTITQFTVGYTGEQWRRGSASANKLAFEYAFDPSNLDAGAYLAAAALDFIAPVTTGAGELNGNLPANRAGVAATVSGLNWVPGQVLVLRWTDVDDSGSDDAVAIDNFTFTTPVATTETLPAVIYTTPAHTSVNIPTNSSIEVMFNGAVNFPGSAVTLAGETSGSHLAGTSGGPQLYTVTPTTPFAEGEYLDFGILASQVTDAATSTEHLSADFAATFITVSSTPLPIHKVQGAGLASWYNGHPATLQGVVTATFQGAGQVGGFYIQALAAQHDADPATSEGIQVFDNTNSVTVGDLVTVAGTVIEYGSAPNSGTEITSLTAFTKHSSGNPLPSVTPVTLPFPSATHAERYEGMLVCLPQTLTVTNNFDLGIFGELVLSHGRLAQPTNVVAPGAPAQALEAANQLDQIALDDGVSTTHPDPTPYLSPANSSRRTGSTTTGVLGILDNKFGGYIIEPTGPVSFADANPRGSVPAVGGTLKVVIGNVLNYFNGNGNGAADPVVAGFSPRTHQRGADNQAEFVRQRDKIIAGIIALAPDVMGLTEVENDRVTNGLPTSYGPTSAIVDLVNGLNAAAPPGTTYAFVDASAVDIVSDDIHCAFIYRTQTVALVGAPAMLNHPAYNGIARNPLAQTFQQISNGEKFTASINHFKSKGSASGGAAATGGISPNPNLDQGDGQGESNYVRMLQANALVAWLATDPTGSGDPDFLILGDLNAYAKEDPIVALEVGNYINLTEAAEGEGGYSYQFGGAFGHLDHALASDSLADQVVDAATWHVNSDEPEYYDYNTEDKSPAQQAINVTGPYRYSDHDPVVIGLRLGPPPAADVLAQLQITKSNPIKNMVTKRYTQVYSVKNVGPTPLSSPVTIIFAGLSPNATLYNGSGVTSVITPLGSPYLNLNIGADNILSPGEIVSRVVEFTNPSGLPISYTVKAVAGPGGR